MTTDQSRHGRSATPRLNFSRTSQTMDSSPFVRLPPEMRNRIYELALSHHEPIEVHAVCPNNRFNRPSVWPITQSRLRALTQTCKAIRAESSKLFFASNDFVLLPDLHSRKYYNYNNTFNAYAAVNSFTAAEGRRARVCRPQDYRGHR